MKRTVVGMLCSGLVASIIPLAGCDSPDTGVPSDTTPGVALDSIKANMGDFKKEQANKKGSAEKAPSTPESTPKN